uniref:Coagulation factor VIII, procoagulant component n=1 Tax=Salarias fasciatus TaxID=181472 RepID=A0A672J286_SALFA
MEPSRAISAALALLLPLVCASAGAAQQGAKPAAHYYIAAVEIGWDYIYLDEADPTADQRRTKDIPQKYIKAVYREYTDSTYTSPKERAAWTGIQGPVIAAQAGDKVVIHFKNLASQPYSISPVGITYSKHSEGVGYDDSTAGQEKEDDAVSPGGYYEYVWDINHEDGPTASDPDCLTYTYSSQVDPVRDLNSGLIGALLICKSGVLTDSRQRKSPAFVLLFAVFDETKSWYGEVGERVSRERFKRTKGRKEYHTINGYVNSTLPGLTMCQGRSPVFWHLIGVGTAPEIHSIRFQDHSLQVLTHRKLTIEVTPLTLITAEMRPYTTGRFPISCQINAHQHDGMEATFTVEKCPEKVAPPVPDVRKVKHKHIKEEEEEDDYYDDMFNTISIQPKKPAFQARSSRGQQSQTWVHYIAAEEITWDYTPHLSTADSEMQSRYLLPAPHHLGYTYKKVAYVEYTDESFTQRKNPGAALLGPLLKGKVNDQFHITFRNMASRPFNIYPNGLSKIYPLQRSTNEAEKDLRSMEVPPNGTFGYVWRLTTDDGPLEGDPTCLTHLYQSTISPERDLASGLVGTLLICRHDAIDVRGKLLGPDKKLSLIFAVFDENKSWYFNENMQRSRENSSSTTDPEFYDSNVIYSVNGIMFSRRQFVMCKSDVLFWHVVSVGTQSDFLSVYFPGNLFQYDGLYRSVLTLFPMTGVTVPMEMELIGEWEISAFDSSLKNRGMSIRYTVRPCNSGELPLVDHDENEDLSDYLDGPEFQARGFGPQNGTVLVKVCKKVLGGNVTRPVNSSGLNVTEEQTEVCQLKRVVVPSVNASDEGIPLDILEELETDREQRAPQNQSEAEEHNSVRQRRHAEGNWTEEDEDVSSGAFEGGETTVKIEGEDAANLTDADNETTGGHRDGNEILSHRESQEDERISALELAGSEDMHENSVTQNYVQSKLDPLTDYLLDLEYNLTSTVDNTTLDLSLEYDDYSEEENSTSDLFATDYLDMRSGEIRPRHYYIAAEEIIWDYGIRTPPQLIKANEMRRGMRKFLPEYKKVVFRAYRDKEFLRPVGRGELEEHLGIMGPVIRTEINDLLTVTFKNKALRPYSFHLQGVYDRSPETSFIQAKPVPPGETRTYNWRVTWKQGPTESEFDCKTGAYYSTVDKDRDLNSGLIGPLVICKSGTLQTHLNTQIGIQEFSLLFHTFDETKSWYMEENLQRYCAPPCQANTADPWYHTSNTFAAINGYVAETLPGLVMAQRQPVRWHLLNVGSDREYHAVHFHGLPFTVHAKEEHRMGVYNLFPGVFGTVEMNPPTVGTWLVECTVGDYQLAGMRAKLLVYNPQCASPLGMKSGRIEDYQITASDHIDYWEPRLARLDQSGYINAWMGRSKKSWLQVDLQKPTLLHGVQTQGVRSRLRGHYITFFSVSYSLDQETWTTYRGNSSGKRYNFHGNLDSSKVKENRFSPPFVARYIRIQPNGYENKPALRLELLGCDVNSCSLPLGRQMRLINDSSFTASSTYSSMLLSWGANLAQLHKKGRANAWRPKTNNPHEWLQVDLWAVRRITGVITQGAQSLLTKLMVTEFSVTVSRDGESWSSVLEERSQREKIFRGNNNLDDENEEALTVFEPPLFGRFLRIHPRGWINGIALRLEVLGCDEAL